MDDIDNIYKELRELRKELNYLKQSHIELQEKVINENRKNKYSSSKTI